MPSVSFDHHSIFTQGKKKPLKFVETIKKAFSGFTMVSEDEAYRPEQEEAAAESEAETEEKTQESVRATTGG